MCMVGCVCGGAGGKKNKGRQQNTLGNFDDRSNKRGSDAIQRGKLLSIVEIIGQEGNKGCH